MNLNNILVDVKRDIAISLYVGDSKMWVGFLTPRGTQCKPKTFDPGDVWLSDPGIPPIKISELGVILTY